ncbi:MAG: hypothetical protein ACK41D_04945, partial [Rubricoccaceae bacterium]
SAAPALAAGPRPVEPAPPERPRWLIPALVAGVALVAVLALALAGVFSRGEAPPPEPVVEEGPDGPTAVAAAVGTTEGRLEEGDFRTPDGRYQDLLTYAADSTGSVLSFEIVSADFLPSVTVRTPDGRDVVGEPLGVVDGSGRVVGVRGLREPGLYRILVSSREPNATGAYQLRIARQEPIRTLTVDAPATSGELGALSVEVNGFLQDAYRFRAEQGRRHEIVVTTGAFVPRLVLSTPAGQPLRAEVVRAGTVSTLAFTPEQTGTYQVVVTTEQAGLAGAYTIRVTAEAPPPPPPTVVPGTLAPNSPAVRDSLAAGQTREFRFAGNVGDRVLLDLRGEGFAPALTLTTPDGNRFVVQPEGTRSRYATTLATTGTYRVLVSAPAEAGGSFLLSLEQEAPVEAAPIPRLPSRDSPPPPPGGPPGGGGGPSPGGSYQAAPLSAPPR